MSLTQFEHILCEVKPITEYIYLHVQGEPLLHPLIEDILTLCDQYQMKVHITTNGTLLEKHLAIFNHPSLRKLSISVHAYDEYPMSISSLIKDYQTLSNRLNKGQYLELRFWNKNNLKTTCTQIIEELKKIYPFTPTKKPNSFLLSERFYLHYDEQFTWPSDEIIYEEKGRCNGVMSMLAILVDGTLTPCCLDQDGSIGLGNIFDESISDILSRPRYQRMIQGLRNQKLVEPLCQQCSYRKRFDK